MHDFVQNERFEKKQIEESVFKKKGKENVYNA